MVGRQHGGKRKPGRRRAHVWLPGLLVLAASSAASAQTPAATVGSLPAEQSRTDSTAAEDVNRRLQELSLLASSPGTGSLQDYRIGASDLLAINVFEAHELSGPVRVSAGGEITLPLIGVVSAGNLTPRELELVLQELLRRNFIKDPHVSVQVTEMESHAVSVMGAVNKPGVLQIRGSRSLLEVLAMAEGLAPDAGSTVQVVRKPIPDRKQAQTVMQVADISRSASLPDPDEGTPVPMKADFLEIDLKDLLESDDARHNVLIYPGDTVTVRSAGLVYVVGEVRKPGGFPLRSKERLTVLQALALGEGLTPLAAKGDALIIRTGQDGQRSKIPVDLGRVLKAKATDISLQERDILFVPGSTTKAIARGSADAVFRMLTFRPLVF
jgi:polysaccharide biosynthesis/export protein